MSGNAESYDDQDVAEQPEFSNAILERRGGELVITVPALGALRAGCAPLFVGGAGSTVAAGLTFAAYANRAPWWAWLIVAGVWLVVWSVTLSLISVAARRGRIVVLEDRLTIDQRGLFFSKRGQWCGAEMLRVGAIPTGTVVNNRPVLALQVLTRERRPFVAFSARPEAELRWFATSIRRALKVPTPVEAAAGDTPNARGYFVLTKFLEWRPGDRIHLHRPEVPPAGYVIVAIIAGGCGAAIARLLVGEWLRARLGEGFVGRGEATVAGAALAAAAAMVLLSGRVAKKDVILDWASGTWRVRTGATVRQGLLRDIEALILHVVESIVRSRDAHNRPVTRTEYCARLDARLANRDVVLLDTDHWESSPDSALGELTPLAERLAAELGVKAIAEAPVKFGRDWLHVWRDSRRWTRVLFLLLLLAVAAGSVIRYRETRKAPEQPVATEG